MLLSATGQGNWEILSSFILNSSLRLRYIASVMNGQIMVNIGKISIRTLLMVKRQAFFSSSVPMELLSRTIWMYVLESSRYNCSKGATTSSKRYASNKSVTFTIVEWSRERIYFSSVPNCTFLIFVGLMLCSRDKLISSRWIFQKIWRYLSFVFASCQLKLISSPAVVWII